MEDDTVHSKNLGGTQAVGRTEALEGLQVFFLPQAILICQANSKSLSGDN